jgi:hypothetical protein
LPMPDSFPPPPHPLIAMTSHSIGQLRDFARATVPADDVPVVRCDSRDRRRPLRRAVTEERVDSSEGISSQVEFVGQGLGSHSYRKRLRENVNQLRNRRNCHVELPRPGISSTRLARTQPVYGAGAGGHAEERDAAPVGGRDTKTADYGQSSRDRASRVTQFLYYSGPALLGAPVHWQNYGMDNSPGMETRLRVRLRPDEWRH